jgi:hypothetical protein
MNVLSRLSLGITVGLLAAACSSNSPASSGSGSNAATGTSSGSGTGASAGTSGATAGTSGTTSGAAGSASGTGSGASSGSVATEAGTSEASAAEASSPEASTTEEASTPEAGGGSDAASVATLTAECTGATPNHGGGVAFSAQDFCTIFISTCVPGYLIASESALGVQSTCETTYAALIASDQVCRTDHVCNATVAGAQTVHCPHAQGWDSATVQAGGPCN